MFLSLCWGGGCEGTEKDDPIQPGVGAANIQQTT